MKKIVITSLVIVVVTFGACKYHITEKSTNTQTTVSSSVSTTIDSVPIPNHTGYVTDLVEIFSPAEKADLAKLIAAYEERTSVQIAVLTIDTTWTSKDSFPSYANKVFNTWGIGQKETNNGILMCICPGYRIMRIENGYGIEKVLSNEETAQILNQDILVHFKTGEYYTGVKSGIEKIIATLDSKEHSSIYKK